MENFKSTDPLGVLQGHAPLIDQKHADQASDEETQFLGELRTRVDEARNYVRELNYTWDYLKLYVEGFQFITRNTITQEYLPVIVDEDTRRRFSCDNIMHVANRAFIGKTTRIIPFIGAIPRTTDREDLMSAELIDSYLDFIYRKERLKLKYKRGADFLGWAGGAVYQPSWDTLAGRKRAVCPAEDCTYQGEESEVGQPCPQCQMEQEQQPVQVDPTTGQPVQQQQQAPILVRGNEGDLVVQVHDPRNFLYDLGATEVEDMLWAGIERVLPIQRIRKMFPDKAHLVQPETDLHKERYIIYSGSLATSRIQTRYLKEHARLLEVHEMPTAEWPNGRVLWVCNERILCEKENIYTKLCNRLPFYPVRGDRRSDRFWGEPLGWQAEPLQRERNKLVTQMREHRELTCAPKVRADHNSGLNMRFLSTDAGEIIKQNPMSRPWDYVRPPEMPSYVVEEAGRLKEAISEKFGVTPHDLGESKSGQSGRFAITLEAQSSEAIAPILIENYDEWREMHRAIVMIGRHFMAPDRVWTTLGKDRTPRSYNWGMANILPGWDVTLFEDDALSRTPAMRLQQAQGLLQLGVFNDPNTGRPDMRQFMRVAGIVLPQAGPDKDGIDRSYALQVPSLVEQALDTAQQTGQPPALPQPKLYDNAKVMADELEGWLKAKRLDPQTRRDVYAMVEQLWQLYAMSIQPTGPADQALMPNPAMQQQAQTQQPANNIATEVDQRVEQTDQAGEQMATSGAPHEG